MTRSTTAALERAIRRMPPLPEVAMRVLEILRDPDYSIADLVHVVRADPNLTARILKLCNSSLYARSAEVASVNEAVSYLGARSLVQVIVSTCTKICFDSVPAGAGFEPAWIRRHAFACASASERIAEHLVGPSPGAAFTCGILHDLGRVALSQAGPVGAALPPVEPGESLIAFERRVFGIDHAAVAEMVAARWTLPHELRRAITHHHDAEFIAVEPPLTAALHTAELLADAAGSSGAISDAILAGIEPNAVLRLGCDAERLGELLQTTREAWRLADEILADDALIG